MATTLVQSILDKDYANLKDSIEKIVAKKIHNRILNEKTKILAKMNNISSDKMVDIIAAAMPKK